MNSGKLLIGGLMSQLLLFLHLMDMLPTNKWETATIPENNGTIISAMVMTALWTAVPKDGTWPPGTSTMVIAIAK